MTAVASTARAGAVHGAAPPAALVAGGGPLPLPPPGIATPSDYQDALLLLMRDEVQQGSANKLVGQAQARKMKDATAVSLKKELEAIEDQRKAEKEANGFWSKLKKAAGTIAKIAAVVACVAGAVFTGGASLVGVLAIAALCLSGSAMLVRETKMFGKDSDKVGLGLDIAAAVVGIAACGAGLANVGTAAASTASTAASTATTAQTAAKTTATTAQLAGAAATGTEAAATVVVADHQHDADMAAADAEDARGQMQMLSRERQMIMDWLQQVSELEADATETTVRTIEGCSKATDVAIAGVKG
jgi:hypothetical protein